MDESHKYVIEWKNEYIMIPLFKVQNQEKKNCVMDAKNRDLFLSHGGLGSLDL